MIGILMRWGFFLALDMDLMIDYVDFVLDQYCDDKRLRRWIESLRNVISTDGAKLLW